MTARLVAIVCMGFSVTAQAADSLPALQFRKELDRGAATGEAIKIKAKTVVRLRPSKAFKDAILK